MSDTRYRHLLSNVSWLGGGELLNRLVGLFIAFYLARVLGPVWYGIVGAAFAVFSFFAIFVQVGLEPRSIREISRQPSAAPVVFARTSALRLVLAISTFAVLLGATPFLAPTLSLPWWLLALYSLCLYPIALSAVWVHRGLERMRFVAFAVAGQRVLIAIGVVLFVRDPETDLQYVALIELAAMTFAAGWAIHRLKRLWGKLSYAPGLEQWKPMLREALPVAGSRFLMMVYTHGDILLLGWLAGPAAAGEFLAADKMILAVWQIAAVFQMASFSETARRVAGDITGALALQADVLRYLLLVSIPCIVAAIIYADPIIALIFGSQYLEAAPVMMIMALSLPLSFAAGCLRQLLFAAALPGLAFFGYSAGVAVHIVLAVLWIPSNGPSGAAWACLAGELAVFVSLAYFVMRRLRGLPWQRRHLAPLAAGTLAGLAVVSMSSAGVLIQVLVAAALYAGLLPILGGITRNELSSSLARLRRWRLR